MADQQGMSEEFEAQSRRQQAIEFVSLTQPLRKGISSGEQAYFTFDQHWTPVGQEIVAEVLNNYTKSSAGKTN